MNTPTRKKIILFVVLVLAAIALVYFFGLEEDSAVKAKIRTLVREIFRAL